MSKYKIEFIDNEPTNFDKAYAIIKAKLPCDLKTKQNAHKWIQGLLAKQHTAKIVILEGKKCCPICNGIQENTFNGNAYYCPYCAQKIKDTDNGK